MSLCRACKRGNGLCEAHYRWDNRLKTHTRSCDAYVPRWWVRILTRIGLVTA